jgi:hypothetical protein
MLITGGWIVAACADIYYPEVLANGFRLPIDTRLGAVAEPRPID